MTESIWVTAPRALDDLWNNPFSELVPEVKHVEELERSYTIYHCAGHTYSVAEIKFLTLDLDGETPMRSPQIVWGKNGYVLSETERNRREALTTEYITKKFWGLCSKLEWHGFSQIDSPDGGICQEDAIALAKLIYIHRRRLDIKDEVKS